MMGGLVETWYLKSAVGDVDRTPPPEGLPFVLEPGGPGEVRGRAFGGPVVVAMGVFDGLHVGHRRVFEQACLVARDRNLPCAVLTFVEHPRTVLHPDRPVPLLTPWPEKRESLAEAGIDRVVAAHFTPAFAELSPEEFVRGILVERLDARHLVVGFNFRFGHRGAGSPEMLQQMAGEFGFGLDVIPPFELSGLVVSSSQIRELLASGKVREAGELLGGPYRLAGEVINGDARARKLGFPTANLRVDERKLLPAYGVYVGVARWPGGRRRCVVNIGIRPTFDPPQLQVEAHLLDFEGDLYGQTVTLELETYLRPERAFRSVNELIDQIHQDVQSARSSSGIAAPAEA